MPKRCAAYGCHGNYRGEPYSRMVRFPSNEDEREAWINALPNRKGTVTNRKDLFICASHFNCAWQTCRGGKRPVGPPTVFVGIPKSCIKQSIAMPRNRNALSQTREQRSNQLKKERDTIGNFKVFEQEIGKRFPQFSIRRHANNVNMFIADESGRNIQQFLSFCEVQSPFGFLFLVRAEKNGYVIPKSNFTLQKNSLVSKWSQIDEIIAVVQSHLPSDADYLREAINQLNRMSGMLDSPNFQFLQSQLEMLNTSLKGRRFSKHTIILAAQLLCISPAAYRMLRDSGAVNLPKEQLIRDLLSSSFAENSLSSLLHELRPEQRLVNILFDEVKLKQAMRFSSGHVLGHSTNRPEELANSALTIELVCNYGGPRFVCRVYPVTTRKTSNWQMN